MPPMEKLSYSAKNSMDANEMEMQRRAANLAKSQEAARVAREKDKAEQARRATNLRKQRAGY